MKIAVSSQDGKTICGHLGKCTQFIIFDADEHGIKHREIRETASLCAHDTGEHKVGLLLDCQAVITQGMGRGMYDGLEKAGIIPVITMESRPETAVRQFMAGGIANSFRGDCSCGTN